MSKDQDRTKVKIGISVEELIAAINELDEEHREFLIENLLAATNPDYLHSIEEARVNYRQGQVLSHNKVFGKADKN